MNNFAALNKLVKRQKNELNNLYKNMDNEIVSKALNLCSLDSSSVNKIAILRRIVDLNEVGIINELKNGGKSEGEIDAIKAKMYDFVSEFYINHHSSLINEVEEKGILEPFYLELIKSVHRIGVSLSKMQKIWQKSIIETTNREFETKFESIAKANEFITKNKLYQTNPDHSRCDRVYGAVIKNGEDYKLAPYAVFFKDEMKSVKDAFETSLVNLEKLSKTKDDESYVIYLTKLKNAFLQTNNDLVIASWQDAERAWMDTKGKIQIGHPLEYYEDAYTHAVALEWDIRLVDDSHIDETKFKNSIKESFDEIYSKTGVKNQNMTNLVHSNIDKTQLYISVPMVYYAAEFNGLFSAQVVPNDEIVSRECGKKIFAFVNFVYESTKAKPFMKLASEIFDKDFLDFGREILYKKPEIWKKVYEISTIGHEFGHILFIDSDTESAMNKSGEFKFIEEYKATTGGLINFFLHEDYTYKMAVFHELIKRSVGLIAWQKVTETRAYYCEGLIHLSLLFRSGVLKFDGKKLQINFTQNGYESFKNEVMQNYINLATHYSNKLDAGEFLAKFAKFEGEIYLPQDRETLEFVKFYYQKYEKMANEIDDSGEWQKWQQA
ncbi:invasion antigen B [Campylobacter fetus subsp. testudinum]|uniref:invasion protein CiaB n=1 Tax=Campylobacter fetus TaxID=196 RepID=UPI0008187CD7|nr:invasion protein CiaB [Campylobacter fetus]OCS00718.1 invasion antigen B [Campylobacter fetus subsp. testudinum]